MEKDILEFIDGVPELELPLRELYVKVMDRRGDYLDFSDFLHAVGNLKREGKVIEYDKLPDRISTVALTED